MTPRSTRIAPAPPGWLPCWSAYSAAVEERIPSGSMSATVTRVSEERGRSGSMSATVTRVSEERGRSGSMSASVTQPERLGVLDVLRGIALLGMFLVHFSERSSGGGTVGALYQKIVELFFAERFWAMFGILFGV